MHEAHAREIMLLRGRVFKHARALYIIQRASMLKEPSPILVRLCVVAWVSNCVMFELLKLIPKLRVIFS